ncbi:hypothetical protein [Candidatus Thioglobus sp.]|uniref:hypothetical protein n=1 Tax=Candidatus Thioglobus sp. TaxID=2026721 RepID=UPI003D1403EC
MKKQILSAFIFATISFNVAAESENCSAGYDNLEHLGSCLGGVADVSIGALAQLPSNATKWTDKQQIKAKERLETIKNNICDKVDIAAEVIVEKIVYVDRIVEVPAKEKIVHVDRIVEVKVPVKAFERRCTTKKRSDRFGNSNEVITCTEWK